MPTMPFSSVTFSIADDAGWENMRRWMVGHRKRMRLSQRVVAERMGTTQSEVSKFERGLTDPYISTVARYIRALDLKPNLNARDNETGQLLIDEVPTPRRRSPSASR